MKATQGLGASTGRWGLTAAAVITALVAACGKARQFGEEAIGDGGAGHFGADTAGSTNASAGAMGGDADASSGVCGDGNLDQGEECDDANGTTDDGCVRCKIQPGWVCDLDSAPSCVSVCGDEMSVGDETKAGRCDDGNLAPGDGCDAACRVEQGYVCVGAPSICAQTCGNGKIDPGEACDDANSISGDGCLACAIEAGWKCDAKQVPTTCADIDECKAEASPCSTHATCTNSPGGYACACKAGYTGDGQKCERTSCVGMVGNECAGTDCCASPVVTGTTTPKVFLMGGKAGKTTADIATFALDKFEVTVGRFRNFHAAYHGPPAKDAGAHPLIAGSGWQTSWNGSIAPDAAALDAAVRCDETTQTWTGSASLPMTCVSWFEAFAFCAWDGGRLPTEAEWEYATAGGTNQLTYAWGDYWAPTYDATDPYAVYYSPAVLPVGSKPAGIGRYDQLDLLGSVWEWTLDYYGGYQPDCNNCANLMPGNFRIHRGGGFSSSYAALTSYGRNEEIPSDHIASNGFRCARNP